MELLDVNKEPGRLSFNNEAKNIEFFEIIGEMDLCVYTDPKRRDDILLNIGKELLKKQTVLENNQGNIYLNPTGKSATSVVLSKEEIDALLTPIKSSDDRSINNE
jgi:hypothetical protein